jgi:NitT/TauT family transport system substrate-binding protein/putative hydroxymethylpyrimidine transport system substrate-binding protein
VGRVRRRAALHTALVTILLLSGCGGEERRPGPRPVTLVLDFEPNGAHAGVYEAVRGRHDAARGVRLRVRRPSATTDGLKLLALGRADLAVVDIHDLGLARERGAEVVGVGALVQRPLAAVIARGVRRPRELEGRRVGVTGLPSDDAVLRAVVESDGGDPGRVRRTTIGFSAVPSLVAGRVAAATAFWNAEGVALRARGVRTREFRVADHGAPRYPELVLVATEAAVHEDRAILSRTLAALEAGTRSAVRDPRGAQAAIERASGADRALVRAQLVAVLPALEPPLRLDRAVLEAWARWDARMGILERPPDVDEVFAFDLLGAR